MRAIAKFALGSLLGISLVLTSAMTAQARDNNCLLFVCVDAPVVGPIVGGIGDGLEDVLSPTTNRPAQPAPQQPVEPPVQQPAPQQPAPEPAPAQPAPQPVPQQPAAPASGGTTSGGPTSPSGSGTAPEGGESGVSDSVTTVPVPGPTTSPSPTPSPTPEDDDPPTILPQDEDMLLSHLQVLTPFIVGAILMLIVVMAVTSTQGAWKSRKKKRGQDLR